MAGYTFILTVWGQVWPVVGKVGEILQHGNLLLRKACGILCIYLTWRQITIRHGTLMFSKSGCIFFVSSFYSVGLDITT